ncbi:hypothetical protein [Paenibacillus daejeonensis]|uniref:hypothetical protein n=1 Tax=Paenibacillus daejeonensis TaxID=135193 RepID=UPI00038037DD|nr:hypothetical protein [Paenibacillus daejeonensis]
MNKHKQTWRIGKPAWPTVLLTGLMIFCSACGVARDTTEGIESEGAHQELGNKSEAIIVEVLVESDAAVATDLEVEVHARKHPESVAYDSITLPYREEFAVPKDTFIPLTSTRVTAALDEDGSWISCTISYDGEVVATHRSRGDGAKAVCEKAFRLGPG